MGKIHSVEFVGKTKKVCLKCQRIRPKMHENQWVQLWIWWVRLKPKVKEGQMGKGKFQCENVETQMKQI